MERITTRVKDRDFEMVEVGTSDDYIKAVDRLADYEDTGLTPPEIMELVERDEPRKIELSAGIPICPVCGRRVVKCYVFCPDCGQRLEQ